MSMCCVLGEMHRNMRYREKYLNHHNMNCQVFSKNISVFHSLPITPELKKQKDHKLLPPEPPRPPALFNDPSHSCELWGPSVSD